MTNPASAIAFVNASLIDQATEYDGLSSVNVAARMAVLASLAARLENDL